jgi:hypothetical protein
MNMYFMKQELFMVTSTRRPIQVYLDERQNRALRRLASQEEATLSELIRRGVDLLLEQVPVEQDPAFQLIGIGSSGVADLGEQHDEYLTQEIEKETRE